MTDKKSNTEKKVWEKPLLTVISSVETSENVLSGSNPCPPGVDCGQGGESYYNSDQ